MSRQYYCKGCGKMCYKSDFPKTLQPFLDYQFSSGGYTGDDFNQFNTKFRNVIKKLLPVGYTIHSWHKNHYESSAVIKDDKGRFIYMSISDVRYWMNEWATDILIRTMEHDKDWHGGPNNRTDLIDFTNGIQKLWR